MKIYRKIRLISSIIWLGSTGSLFTPVSVAFGTPFSGLHAIESTQPETNCQSEDASHQVSGLEKSHVPGTCLYKGTSIFLAENRTKSAESPQAANQITGIRFEAVYSGQEKVIISGRGISPPHIFALEGENPRIVCDFKGTELASDVGRKISTNGKLIKMIRTGSSKDEGVKVRVVLDLSPEGSYEVEQTFYKNHGTYVLIIKPEKIVTQ